MNEVKQTVDVRWARSRHTKEVRIARDAYGDDEQTRQYYANTHVLETTTDTLTGTVEVTVMVDEIVRQIAGLAAHNASGKAVAMSGLVKARRVAQKIVDSKTVEHPIPPGYSVLGHEVKQ